MKDNKKSNKDKFDYKGYVSNLGKVGTFYKDKKDSKGTEGTLVSIAEKGVYAMVAKMPFPVLFTRATFGEDGTLKLNGKTYKLVEQKGSKSKSSNKNSRNNNSKGHSVSSNEYGQLDNSKQAKAMYSFLNWFEENEPDTKDDDDCDEVVEKWKKALKAFN